MNSDLLRLETEITSRSMN